MTMEERMPNERLRQARSQQGWSQARLAQEVGTSFEMVSRWERGINKPSSYFRARLCAALGTTAEELGFVQGPGELPVPLVSPYVFLACSHADIEKAIVIRIETILQERGMALCSNRQISRSTVEHPRKALRETIRASQVILLIVSPQARSSRHIREALDMSRMYQRPVCAVWIEGEHWQECLPLIENELPISIDARTRNDPCLFEEIATMLQHAWPDSGTSTASALTESDVLNDGFARVPASGTSTVSSLAETEAREDMRLQQAISQDAARWQQHGKPKDRLYRGSQLLEAQAWAMRNSPSSNEMAFLHASTAARMWHGISVLTLVLLLIAMAGLTIWLSLQLPPDPARVTTLQNDGPGSLRWAIENAPAGSTITFDKSLKGTLLLSGDNLHISKPLHIRGPGAERLTISGGKKNFGIEVLLAGSTSIISDLTFKASYIYNAGTLTLTNSIAAGDRAVNIQAYDGGAISNDGTLTLISSTVSGNIVSHDGGGIYNDGTLKLVNSTVSGNTASHDGGGIYNDGTLTLVSSTVTSNTASHDGGGIYNEETLKLVSSTVSGNKATTLGGGIANMGRAAQTAITFCTISGNTASHDGGGIWNGADNGARQLVIRISLIAGNRAAHSPDIAGKLTSGG
jgi:predicted outer membrane repeat protein